MRHLVLSTARAQGVMGQGFYYACWEGKTKMADTLRAAFTSVTETVFPMSRSIRHNPRHHMLSTGLKILFLSAAAIWAMYFTWVDEFTAWCCWHGNNFKKISFNFIFTGNEIVSNLALQMSLYFNVYFSPFWYTTCIVMLVAKVKQKLSCS